MPRIFDGALRRQRDIAADERAGVELGVGGAARAHIAAEQRHLHLLRHVDARVLQQRGEVVGRRPHHRVLEIEDADPRELRCGPAATAGWANGSRAAPRSAARSIAGCSASRQSAKNSARASSVTIDAEPRQIPVEQQLRLDQQRVHVVGAGSGAPHAARPAARRAAACRAARAARRPRPRSAPTIGAGGSPATTPSSPRSSMTSRPCSRSACWISGAVRPCARSPFAIATNGTTDFREMRDLAVGLAVASPAGRPAAAAHSSGWRAGRRAMSR